MQFGRNRVWIGSDYRLRDGCLLAFALVGSRLLGLLLVVVVGCGCFTRWGYALSFVGMGMSICVTNL
jgi:hypothetical protein